MYKKINYRKILSTKELMLRTMVRHFNNITTIKNAGVEGRILEGYIRSVE
jgi:hypothetical protein